LKTAEGGDPQARMDVETQLRSMNALVDKSARRSRRMVRYSMAASSA